MHNVETDDDLNIVALWLRKDPVRWVAGALAGAFAGFISLAFAMVLASALGFEFLYPAKLAALPILGNVATAYDSSTGVIVGILFYEALCALLGVFYAHVTATNSFPALLGAGLTFGAFSWIFLFNLYFQSFTAFHWAHIPPGAAFPVLMVFGISLASVAFFDRILRGNRG
jgi:hypothetical protein